MPFPGILGRVCIHPCEDACRRGQLNEAIIHAIAAGRKAAASIDKAIGGPGDIDEVLFPRSNPGAYLGRYEGFASCCREKVSELDAGWRIRDFQEVALGYGDEQAAREAKRCLQCDLRLHLGCNPVPP